MVFPHLTPLPPIWETHEQKTAQLVIDDIMKNVTRHLQGSDSHVVMLGGTALRIGHGLTRPSLDIDVNVVGNPDIWTLFREAADNAGHEVIVDPHRSNRLKGNLRIPVPPYGTIDSTIDLRFIRPAKEPEAVAAIRSGESTEVRQGVLMYRPEILCNQKFDLAEILADDRLRAKDRYDIAWWLTERIKHVPPRLRQRLDRVLLSRPGIHDFWDKNHRAHNDLKNLNPDTVRHVLNLALNLDPVVLKARFPDGHLNVELSPANATGLSWNHGTPDQPDQPIAHFDSNHELQNYMVAYGLWKSRDVPELLRDLERERQRLIERDRGLSL